MRVLHPAVLYMHSKEINCKNHTSCQVAKCAGSCSRPYALGVAYADCVSQTILCWNLFSWNTSYHIVACAFFSSCYFLRPQYLRVVTLT